MKKFFFCSFLFFSILAVSQPYPAAFGLRLGFASGLSFKGFINQKGAIEAFATYQLMENGFGLTGLYEHHNYRVFKSNHFGVFYGGGMHIAYYLGGLYKNRELIIYTENTFNAGLDFIIGLDYHEPGTPLNWSIDVKPMYDFYNAGFRFWDGAVSIRYAF